VLFCEVFKVSAGAQERISSLKRARNLTISSVLLESLGQTTFGAYARVIVGVGAHMRTLSKVRN
jgi:hypothetical protein